MQKKRLEVVFLAVLAVFGGCFYSVCLLFSCFLGVFLKSDKPWTVFLHWLRTLFLRLNFAPRGPISTSPMQGYTPWLLLF